MKSLIEFKYFFYCDLKNFFKLFIGLIFKKTVIISSKRWVNNESKYQKEILKNIKEESSENCEFVYFQIKTLDADNQFLVHLREEIYNIFIDNFELLSNSYQLKMINTYKKKVKHLVCENNLKNIKNN